MDMLTVTPQKAPPSAENPQGSRPYSKSPSAHKDWGAWVPIEAVVPHLSRDLAELTAPQVDRLFQMAIENVEGGHAGTASVLHFAQAAARSLPHDQWQPMASRLVGLLEQAGGDEQKTLRFRLTEALIPVMPTLSDAQRQAVVKGAVSLREYQQFATVSSLIDKAVGLPQSQREALLDGLADQAVGADGKLGLTESVIRCVAGAVAHMSERSRGRVIDAATAQPADERRDCALRALAEQCEHLSTDERSRVVAAICSKPAVTLERSKALRALCSKWTQLSGGERASLMIGVESTDKARFKAPALFALAAATRHTSAAAASSQAA